MLALDNVRKLIGIHRARFCVTGAAPISPDLVRWYLALGVPMLEVWGMTESCGASTYTPAAKIKPGMIGPACPYNEVRLDPQTCELQVRGRNVFMGYLNLPEKTAEAFDADGWLRTGDVGMVDADGYFRITDRMKDIIITAGGKNITPSEIENELKFSPYITDAVVIGDKRAYLTAIVMIDQDNVEKFAQDRDIPFSNYTSLTRAQPVKDLIRGEIERVNGKFARVEQMKKFCLLETRLSAEDEELTPTMKLKRKLVEREVRRSHRCDVRRLKHRDEPESRPAAVCRGARPGGGMGSASRSAPPILAWSSRTSPDGGRPSRRSPASPPVCCSTSSRTRASRRCACRCSPSAASTFRSAP